VKAEVKATASKRKESVTGRGVVVPNRLTRLGEFSLVGPLFCLGLFKKNFSYRPKDFAYVLFLW
jgi:hypothetical protein